MIFDFFYALIRMIIEGIIGLFYNPSCDICKGFDGHCNECKYNTTPGYNGTKNLFKKDWDRIYRK